MKIYNIKVNHFTNPIGYVLDPVTISWNVDEKSIKTRITVSLSRNMKSIIYDTDYHELDNLSTVLDIDLMPYTRYYFRIEVMDENNNITKSKVNYFETAKLNEPWKAEWISPDVDYSPILYTNFKLKGEVKQARLYISGLGIYETYINNSTITDEYLLPGYHAYNTYIQYQTFDVTKYLNNNNNKLEIWLGNGWYKGRFGFNNTENIYGDKLACIFELHIEYKDGSTDLILSNEKIKVKECPVLNTNNIYDGETYNANLEKDRKHDHVVLLDKSKDLLTERYSLPIVKMEKRKAKLIITPKGERVLDFGQNMTGWVEFDACKDISLIHGEILQDGNFYNDNYRQAKATYSYIGDGKTRHVRPHFTFFGFRYVKVVTEGEVDVNNFIAYLVYSKMNIISTFKSGNDKINQLVSNAIWSQKDNFLDVPTDCPQRDERMGWTGDAQIFASTACMNMDTTAFYAKYLKDMLEEQKLRGGDVSHTIPNAESKEHIEKNTMYNASPWADSATIIPWTIYESFGDAALLKKHYENMKMWINRVVEIDDENGTHYLWTTGFHFADWLALDNYKEPMSPMGATDMYFVASCYYYYSAKLTSKAAKVLGYEEDYEYYKKLAKKVKKAIQNEYITPNGRCSIQTQTALVLLLYFNLVKKEHVQRTVDELVKMINDNQGFLTTGFVGTPYLCHVLSDHDHSDLAYELLLNEEYPGWLYEINLGATTIWERWNSVMSDGHMNPQGMNSLNHYSYGAIVDWIYKVACGLKSTSPGYKTITIAPCPNYALRKIDYSYQSASGKISISWEIQATGNLYLQVTIPQGIKATLILPDSNEAPIELSAGTYEYNYQPSRNYIPVINYSSKIKEIKKNKQLWQQVEIILKDVFETNAMQINQCMNYTFEDLLNNPTVQLHHNVEPYREQLKQLLK